MSLIHCTKCGHLLSTTAPKCPGCGMAPYRREPIASEVPRSYVSHPVIEGERAQPAIAETVNPKNQTVNVVRALVALLFAIIGAWYLFGGGLEKEAANNMSRIENQVAEDAVKQYQIASRNGTAMDICVQAGLVTAAFLQAKDEANYHRWKSIEENDCARAGVPQLP
jgi:predicted  nucleic acid-binding Zn-ribbon protein